MLRLRDIRAAYGDRVVLDGVSLDVARGTMVALAGPNGCGKTTLLRVAAGTLPFEGEARIDDTDVRRAGAATMARLVAVVPQAAPLPERFTAFDVALMGRTPHLRLLQTEGRRDIEAVRRAMERADCWDLRERFVDELSGGERQRVVVARALAQEPRLLLLDEPTSHLDLAHQVATFALMRDLCARESLAVVAVVHDLTLAAQFADRIALMSRGRIVADGAPGDVLTPASIEAVYGVAARVLAHPTTARPVVVPDVSHGAGAKAEAS